MAGHPFVLKTCSPVDARETTEHWSPINEDQFVLVEVHTFPTTWSSQGIGTVPLSWHLRAGCSTGRAQHPPPRPGAGLPRHIATAPGPPVVRVLFVGGGGGWHKALGGGGGGTSSITPNFWVGNPPLISICNVIGCYGLDRLNRSLPDLPCNRKATDSPCRVTSRATCTTASCTQGVPRKSNTAIGRVRDVLASPPDSKSLRLCIAHRQETSPAARRGHAPSVVESAKMLPANRLARSFNRPTNRRPPRENT